MSSFKACPPFLTLIHTQTLITILPSAAAKVCWSEVHINQAGFWHVPQADTFPLEHFRSSPRLNGITAGVHKVLPADKSLWFFQFKHIRKCLGTLQDLFHSTYWHGAVTLPSQLCVLIQPCMAHPKVMISLLLSIQAKRIVQHNTTTITGSTTENLWITSDFGKVNRNLTNWTPNRQIWMWTATIWVRESVLTSLILILRFLSTEPIDIILKMSNLRMVSGQPMWPNDQWQRRMATLQLQFHNH